MSLPFESEITRLFNAGQTYTQIAAALGLTKGIVAGRCRRLGLVRDGSVKVGKWKGRVVIPAQEQTERAIDMRDLQMLTDLDAGHSIRSTARNFDVAYSYLRRLAEDAKGAGA